jgi:hypothetical protein
MMILNSVFMKHGLMSSAAPPKTFFDLGKDPEALKKEMLEIGFSGIRMWHQAMNFKIMSPEEYLESIMDSPPALAGFNLAKSAE